MQSLRETATKQGSDIQVMGLKVDGFPERQKAVEQRTGVLEENFKLVKATGEETRQRVDTKVASLKGKINHISTEVGIDLKSTSDMSIKDQIDKA